MAEPNTVSQFEAEVRARPLPRHVAVIMDGNGRWAEQRGLPRVAGHREGAESVRSVTRLARRIGIEALTLYAFSAENWGRPEPEVLALMSLLADFLEGERPEMMANGVRLNAIGELERLPVVVQRALAAGRAETAQNTGLTLTLALSYGGRQEIVAAARKASVRGSALALEDIEAGLWTVGLPELDLLIRTSGERRISNFLLWQSAYAELHFAEELWPDFRERELLRAIADFQGRQRRFGLTGVQRAGQGTGTP